MIHRDEPVLVQILVAELAVEALDVLDLDRLARPDERQADVVLGRVARRTRPRRWFLLRVRSWPISDIGACLLFS
jgi:hypothetical protein